MRSLSKVRTESLHSPAHIAALAIAVLGVACVGLVSASAAAQTAAEPATPPAASAVDTAPPAAGTATVPVATPVVPAAAPTVPTPPAPPPPPPVVNGQPAPYPGQPQGGYPPPPAPGQYPQQVPPQNPQGYPQGQAPVYGVPQNPGQPALYGQTYQKKGYHTHEGLFLRLALGIGFMGQILEGGNLMGPSIPFEFAIGANVAPGFILHGSLRGDTTVSTRVSGGGQSDWSSSSLSFFGLGFGMTKYLGPSNSYFSVVAEFVGAQASQSETNSFGGTTVSTSSSADLGSGFGGSLAFGKEWWVSDNWGLGIAARGFYNIVFIDTIADETHHGFGGGVVFSATYD